MVIVGVLLYHSSNQRELNIDIAISALGNYTVAKILLNGSPVVIEESNIYSNMLDLEIKDKINVIHENYSGIFPPYSDIELYEIMLEKIKLYIISNPDKSTELNAVIEYADIMDTRLAYNFHYPQRTLGALFTNKPIK